MAKTIKVGNLSIGGKSPFVLMAGPCVIEGRAQTMSIAKSLKEITKKCNVGLVFKASYDKANRTSIDSYRGPGLSKGLEILEEIKSKFKVPVVSDIHTPEETKEAAQVLDILQIPAFLSRQTDLLVAAGKTGKVINVKKGQFLSPSDMKHAIKKISAYGNTKIMLTERGSSFGYNNLVTDFRSLSIMRDFGYPVVIDASHSVQQPGGLGSASGGKSEYIPLMARCGIAAGCDAVFMEVHTNPKIAKSDGPNMLPLKKLEKLLKELKAIDKVVKKV